MAANDSLIEEFPDVEAASTSGIEEFQDGPEPVSPRAGNAEPWRFGDALRPGYSTEVARGLTQFVPALVKTTSVVGDKLGNIVRQGVGLDPLPLEVPEARPLYKVGQWFRDKLDAAYPAVPEPDRNLGHDVSTGLGQMASMVAGGLAARGAGATLKGAALASTALGFGQEFDDAFSRARQRGDDPDTALWKSMGYASLAAMIENKLGAGRIIKKYFPDPAEAARKLSAWGVSKATALSLAVGFGEEGSQRFAQNWIVEGKPSLEGIVQEGAPGGIVQAIAELPATLLRTGGRGGRVRSSLPRTERRTDEETARPIIPEVAEETAIRQSSPDQEVLGGQESQSEKQLGLRRVVEGDAEPQKPAIAPASKETPVTIASVLAMTPAQYFDVSAQWSAESMSEAGGISPQIRAELAAKANPDLKVWQDAQAKASADFAALRTAAKADPNMMGNSDFQKQFSGAAQRASFFSEGRAVLDKTKQFDPRTVALSPEPASVNAQRSPAGVGVPAPVSGGTAPVPTPGKPLWEMSKSEFEAQDKARFEQTFPPGEVTVKRLVRTPNGNVDEGGKPVPQWTEEGAKIRRLVAIKEAQDAGNAIPPEVLADYPKRTSANPVEPNSQIKIPTGERVRWTPVSDLDRRSFGTIEGYVLSHNIRESFRSYGGILGIVDDAGKNHYVYSNRGEIERIRSSDETGLTAVKTALRKSEDYLRSGQFQRDLDEILKKWGGAGRQSYKQRPSGKGVDSGPAVRAAIAEAKKNGPSPEFRALFGGIDPDAVGTTNEKVKTFASAIGLEWIPVPKPATQPETKPVASVATPTPATPVAETSGERKPAPKAAGVDGKAKQQQKESSAQSTSGRSGLLAGEISGSEGGSGTTPSDRYSLPPEGRPEESGGEKTYSFTEEEIRTSKPQVERKRRPNGDDITTKVEVNSPLEVTDSKNWPHVNPDHIRYTVEARGDFESRKPAKKSEPVWRVWNPKLKEFVATGLAFNDAVSLAKSEMVKRNFGGKEPTPAQKPTAPASDVSPKQSAKPDWGNVSARTPELDRQATKEFAASWKRTEAAKAEQQKIRPSENGFSFSAKNDYAKQQAVIEKEAALQEQLKNYGAKPGPTETPTTPEANIAERATSQPAPNLGTGLAEGRGMSPDEARVAVAGEFTGGFDVEFISKVQAEALTGKPKARRYGGFFWNGKIYLVHENMARGDVAGAKELLREEVGHGLLRTAEGSRLLRDALDAGRLQLTEAQKQALRDQGYGEANLLDEFIAKSARENLPWWKAAVEQVRVWLSRVGLANLSNEEVARLLLKQIRRANEGEPSLADAVLPALAANISDRSTINTLLSLGAGDRLRNKYGAVDWERLVELGETKNWREAGYIAPEGQLIDLSGKNEGGSPRERGLDHRELGGTRGMIEAMAAGFIRVSLTGGQASIDVATKPTRIQKVRLFELMQESGGNVSLDLQRGTGKWSEHNQSYESSRDDWSNTYDNADPQTVLDDIDAYYEGRRPGIGLPELAPGPPTGSTVDPATGERISNAEGDAEVVQIAGIEYNIIAKERLTAEQKAAADTRARDFFGKELNLPGEPDLSYGKQRGAIDTNIVFKIEPDGENHDNAGEALLKHLTEQIQSQHQPGGDPAYVSSLVNAINKNFNVGNLNGVFSDGMIERLMNVSAGESSWRGTMLRAITGITEDMGTVARNARFFLRRTYENMFGGDLVRKIMDRIALNFRERFSGEEIERLYNENPILQELFLKVVSRLNVKPSLREVIQEIFNTRIDRQDDIVEKFVDTMVNKFSATPSEAARLKAEFSRTFVKSFAAAREKAQAKALATLLPEERKVIGAQTPLWKKLTNLVNSGWLDSARVVEDYARSKGMAVPTAAELEQMRNWSIKEQSLREPTATEIATHGESLARSNAESATLEARQDLLRKMNTQWSRWTHPIMRSVKDVFDPVKRYNTAMAANEWLTANLLLKVGFGSRQVIDIGTQMVLHTPTRAAQYAFEQWSNDRSAGRDTNLLHDLSQAMTDAYRTRLKVIGDTLSSFKRTLAGRGEQKNVEQLLSSIAVFDQALLKADEMKAQGKPASARFLTLLALTMRFGRQFAAAADVIQGVPAEVQEMAHQIRTGLREQGKGKLQQDLEFNTILGLLTTARVESLAQARQVLESRGLDISNSSVQRAAWHILREKIYSLAKTAGLPADEWKKQNYYYRNVIGWNEPESQGFGGIGGPGGLVAMTAKAGKEVFSRAGIPAFPFVFGNAMGIALNRKLAYTPLGFFPGFFKGSPWFEGERNQRQRKIEATIGTTIGSTLFTLAALGIWVVLPRKWPDDEKEKARWTANGWQPGMLIVPVSDTHEQKISTRVGPMALLSPYLAAGGAFRDALTEQAKKQAVLDERAKKLGLKAEKLEGLDPTQWLSIVAAAGWASAAGGRTASGMLGSMTDFGQLSAKKTGASWTSSLLPGLPGYQEISRMAGANINPKLASFWDLLVPLPTSDASRVNMLGDPMRNENDVERIFQVLSGGTAPLPTSSEAFKKNKAYTNLFESEFRPPAINPSRGYQFGSELRAMSEPELQRYTTERGRRFSTELQGVDLAGLTPAAAQKTVQQAFQRANAGALQSVGATAPQARSSATPSILPLPAISRPSAAPSRRSGRIRSSFGSRNRLTRGRIRSSLASFKSPRLKRSRIRGIASRRRYGRVRSSLAGGRVRRLSYA